MNAFDPLTHSQQLLFALIKLALWNTVPDKALFDKADNAVWNEVYRLSAEQGIKAVVFDGVMLLPEELQPPRSIKLAWAVNVEAIERRYEQQLAIVNEMADIFANNNIKTLLFKGLSLAQYYPVPKHREFGDIDFYLFGKQDEGNRLLTQIGAIKEKYNSSRKHTGLLFKNISLENHNYLLSRHKIPNAAILETYLLKTFTNCKSLNSDIVHTALLFPPPDFNVLFMACHTLGHYLDRPLVLRYLCDWALFLKANKGAIDFATYRQKIAESGLPRLADAFTALTVKYLELDPELAPPYDSNPVLEDKMIHELFSPLCFPQTEKRTLLNVTKYTIKVLKAKKRKFNELLYPHYFWKSLWESIRTRIIHPTDIIKMQTK